MSFDLSQAGSYLFRLVARARRRKFRVDLVEASLDALFCLSFLVAAFFLLDRIRLEIWPRGSCLSPREWIFTSVVTAAAISLVYGLARAWWKILSPIATAKGIDDAFGLHDRVGTSIDVVEGRAAGRLGPMVVADTVRTMQALDVRRAFPFAAPDVRVLSALALGVTLWLAWLPLPSPTVTATEEDPYYMMIAARSNAGEEASGNDPYVRFDKLPDDPKNTPPKSWKPPKEREYPPYNHEKPPKTDPPSALPNPDFNPKPQPKAGGGGGGGGGQPPPPKGAGGQPPPPKGGGGQQPGSGGGDNPLFGPKERVPVNLLPKEVKPLLGQGHGKVKEMAIDDGSGDPGTGAGGAPATSDFKTLYQQYKGVMESSLPQERIPVEDRDLVKRYFQEIEPK